MASDDDADGMSPFDDVSDLKSVGGYSFVVARPSASGGNAGTMLRRIVIQEEGGVVADFALRFEDLAFLVFTLSQGLAEDSKLMERFGTFKYLGEETAYRTLIRYLASAHEQSGIALQSVNKLGFVTNLQEVVADD